MRQVFCRNCRFFLDATRPGLRRCLHPHARYVRQTALAPLQLWRPPEARNAHNACADYRRLRLWERLVRIDPAFLMVGGLLVVVLVWVWCVYEGRVIHGPIRPL